jgi:hypothetical protein
MQGFDVRSVLEGALNTLVGFTGLSDLAEVIGRLDKEYTDENFYSTGFYSQLARGDNMFATAATEE